MRVRVCADAALDPRAAIVNAMGIEKRLRRHIIDSVPVIALTILHGGLYHTSLDEAASSTQARSIGVKTVLIALGLLFVVGTSDGIFGSSARHQD
jgi:hypothetical protein